MNLILCQHLAFASGYFPNFQMVRKIALRLQKLYLRFFAFSEIIAQFIERTSSWDLRKYPLTFLIISHYFQFPLPNPDMVASKNNGYIKFLYDISQ